MSTAYNQLIADIEAKAQAKREERLMKILSTSSGEAHYLYGVDTAKLQLIVDTIEDVTGKPLFSGYTYSTNVETIVAIASALQYMKGPLRDSVPEGIWKVFNGNTRDAIIKAYGSLPYLAQEVLIEVNGEMINVDPEAPVRARAGVKPNVQALDPLVNSVAMDLGLLAEYNCTQGQADMAWKLAVNKLNKQEVLDSYKDSL